MVKMKMKRNLLHYYKNEILLGVFLGIIVSMLYLYMYKYRVIFKNPQQLKDIIDNSGDIGVLLFIFIQMIQVVLFFIPGEFIALAGGYIYGVFWASLMALTGITLGSLIIFWVSRRLGRPFVEKITSSKNNRYINKLLELDGKEGRVVILLLYLIPGLPKDILGYISGITRIHFRDFIVFSTLGRIPGIVITSAIGTGMFNGHKLFLLAIALVIFAILLWSSFKGETFFKLLRERS